MAGLNPPGGSGSDSTGDGGDRDRAQVMLVAAFSLAVAFVALSVVINGAIFTQNLATRGDTAGGGDALQQRQQAEQMVGDLLEHANANYSGTTDTAREFRSAISDLSNASSYQQSVSGRAVDYEYVGASNGTRLYQDSPGDFTNASAGNNWTVAENVDNTRRFDINVTDTGELEDPGDKPLTVDLTDTSSGDTWRLSLAENGGTLNLTTTYADGSGGVSSTCTTPDPSSNEVTINVTAGLFAGQSCEALAFGRNVSGGANELGTYDIRFNNTANVNGTYQLTVDTTSVGNAPNDESAVYSTTVEYTYRTANLIYETDIRVAPGEPDE